MGVIGSNGKSDEQLREEQRQNRFHQSNLQAAAADEGIDDKAYLDKITEHDLQAGTISKLDNLLDQFALSNLDEAEVHEYRWLARVMRKEVEAMHPRRNSVFQGDVRAAAYDDTSAALEPLTEREKAVIEQFIMAAIARATRGREGWQQEMFNKTISASETREVDENETGGLFAP